MRGRRAQFDFHRHRTMYFRILSCASESSDLLTPPVSRYTGKKKVRLKRALPRCTVSFLYYAAPFCIFLYARPTVAHIASMYADLKQYRQFQLGISHHARIYVHVVSRSYANPDKFEARLARPS